MFDKAIPLRSRASNSAFEGKDWGDSNKGVVDTPQAERFSPHKCTRQYDPSGQAVGSASEGGKAMLKVGGG